LEVATGSKEDDEDDDCAEVEDLSFHEDEILSNCSPRLNQNRSDGVRFWMNCSSNFCFSATDFPAPSSNYKIRVSLRDSNASYVFIYLFAPLMLELDEDEDVECGLLLWIS